VKRYVVGLTGGIGSGKSEVARLFADRGVAVVDTDAIAHELTVAGGAAMGAIRAAFGQDVIAPDGALDRVAMRRLAFSDSTARGRLESILHPMIRRESDARLARARSPYVILVVPLLVESGVDRRRYQRVLVVDAPEDQQVARVASRSGLGAREISAIMSAQAPRAERLSQADDIIDNSGPIGSLDAQVDRLHAAYLARAAEFGATA
jgi:dephospho-CoA kinase